MRALAPLLTALCLAAPAAAFADCGADFPGFLRELKAEALKKGHSNEAINRFLANARQDPKVLTADRKQGVFQMDFTSFSKRLISDARTQKGRALAKQHGSTFARAEQQYGVPRGVLLAFWAFETDYGSYHGDFNTLNALLTLAHDCRRPTLFRPQIFAALELFEKGDFDPVKTTGAWAGEIGMVQMLPRDILENGVDGDGDGHISLKTSPADALLSGAKMLQSLGWKAGQPWLQEVDVPASMDWSLSGTGKPRKASDWAKMGVKARSGALPNLPANLILPQGHKGPAFLAYPNFDVYFEWNQSFTYVLTAAEFANRLMGAPAFRPKSPEAGLSGDQMKQLQFKLARRGHDVGKVDGILGSGTRAAVQAEQKRLGLPADGWPTKALLRKL